MLSGGYAVRTERRPRSPVPWTLGLPFPAEQERLPSPRPEGSVAASILEDCKENSHSSHFFHLAPFEAKLTYLPRPPKKAELYILWFASHEINCN